MSIAVVVGNPKPASRTLQVATAVADAISRSSGIARGRVVDLAAYGGRLFDWADDELAALNAEIAATQIVVFASPTYKASYTALLKSFLDRYDTGALGSVLTAPVMTGGSPLHSLAVDTALRPLLCDLGAYVPFKSLYFMTGRFDELASVIDAWAESNRLMLDLLAAGEGRP